MLSEQQFNNKWTEIKGGIRNLWGRITDEELEALKNNLPKLTNLVEERYGETRKEVKSKFDQLMDSFDNDTDKNIDLDRTSYQRSPIEERTSAESQFEDEVTDYSTRSSERSEFEDKSFQAGHKEIEDPRHHSNYASINPNRERLAQKKYDSDEIYEEETKKTSFDRSEKNARH